MKFGFKDYASILFGLAVFSVSLQAKAAEPFKFIDNPTFYVGGGAGSSSVDTGVSATTGTAKLDEDDTGLKLFAGVNLNKILSVEAFYADLGEASLSGKNNDTFKFEGTTYTFTATATIETEGTSYGIVPVFGYDVTKSFRPFAKLGLHQWDLEATVTSSAGNASLSDSGTDVIFGGGFMYKFYKKMALRAEYERFKFDEEDVDLISASLQYTF